MLPPTANPCDRLYPKISEKRRAATAVEQSKLQLLGASFAKLWPVDQTPCFDDLLHTIDVEDHKPHSHRS